LSDTISNKAYHIYQEKYFTPGK